MNLSELKPGQRAIILRVHGTGQFRKRILEMGFIQGKEVLAVQGAPLRDPMHYRILGYDVSLRLSDAELIDIELLGKAEVSEPAHDGQRSAEAQHILSRMGNNAPMPQVQPPLKPLRIALVGNPNCGKTSLFNQASGAHEHVGNYSGVTVEAKRGHIDYKGYRLELIDLPGSYSLSPYSPEELYIRSFLSGSDRPDIVLNVLDTTNLERNLYLTVQIKEMGLPVVAALNMFDEFARRAEHLDYPRLSRLLGVPMIPTVSRTGLGIQALLDEVIATWEGIEAADPEIIDPEQGKLRPITVSYGLSLEAELATLQDKALEHLPAITTIEARYIAIKLLEGDKAMETELMQRYAKGAFLISARNYALKNLEVELGQRDAEERITDARYGFIAGALRETYRPTHQRGASWTERIDHIVTHRLWGFPIFLLMMFLMFEATFVLGAYPMEWIEAGVSFISEQIGRLMADGPLKDLILEGIIAGVGGVIVFLPNILILYLFISIFEDSGYMARAAFIMDKLMHRMGLHGKSFIPLIMGFGCNVPAVMATRTIESRKSRIITMLVLPFMSCSARLPVYILLAGALMPQRAGLVLFGLYITGVLIAVVTARVLRDTWFRGEDVPFVMELPPYRMPTLRSVVRHMWSRAGQYLRKMGTVILVASIIIWFLGYFPRNSAADEQLSVRTEQVEARTDLSDQEREELINELQWQHDQEHQAYSFIGRLGKFIEPAIAPLGFDWKMGISLLSGLPAKEVVVSTLGVIYTGNSDDSDEAQSVLSERIRAERRADGSPSFTPLIAFGFMLFVLIYFPCVATIIAIARESGSWRWGAFAVLYSCSLAWIVSCLCYQIGRLFFP